MCQLPFLYVIITIFILKYWLYTNSYFFLPVDVSNLIQLMISQLQWILHNWNDEDSVTILKRCKEAILKNGKGKVMIIEIIIGSQIKTNKEFTEVQLCDDLIMMATFFRKERSPRNGRNYSLLLDLVTIKLIPSWVRGLLLSFTLERSSCT